MPPELVMRFRAALNRLNPGGGKIGLAVSGGPDSMAMLLLAHEAIPGAFEVATVNHGLRAKAADECALVAKACEERGVACEILSVEVGKGNILSEAREARYVALARWAEQRCLRAVATAHHIDDQAETFLMRLNRGSGLAGLAAVREKVLWPVPLRELWRPLLAFRRAELDQVITAADVRVVSDPSNDDPAYDRVRMRQALAATDWINPLAIARTASNLAQAEEALGWAADREIEEQVVFAKDEVRYRRRAPQAIGLLVIGRILFFIGRGARGSDVARLYDQLEAGRSGNLGSVLATVEGDEWVFRPEPPRRTG